MRSFTLTLFSILLIGTAALGSARTDTSHTLQPTIMVIPFTPEGQSLRKKLETDEFVRVAVAKVKEGFDNRGVNTIDLRARLKQVNNIDVLEANAVDDIKNQVIEMSGADIYVEVESQVNKGSGGNSVTIILTAFDAFSGQSFSNKVANSPSFYTDKYEKLIEKAVDSIIEDFLNTIQSKFDQIVTSGRSVVLNFSIADGAAIDFDSEFGGDLLSDLLENWVNSNAYKGYYHLQGMTNTKMIFDEIKVPLKDPATGNNFRVTRFAAELRKYLQSLNIQAERTVQGNNLVFILK